MALPLTHTRTHAPLCHFAARVCVCASRPRSARRACRRPISQDGYTPRDQRNAASPPSRNRRGDHIQGGAAAIVGGGPRGGGGARDGGARDGGARRLRGRRLVAATAAAATAATATLQSAMASSAADVAALRRAIGAAQSAHVPDALLLEAVQRLSVLEAGGNSGGGGNGGGAGAAPTTTSTPTTIDVTDAAAASSATTPAAAAAAHPSTAECVASMDSAALAAALLPRRPAQRPIGGAAARSPGGPRAGGAHGRLGRRARGGARERSVKSFLAGHLLPRSAAQEAEAPAAVARGAGGGSDAAFAAMWEALIKELPAAPAGAGAARCARPDPRPRLRLPRQRGASQDHRARGLRRPSAARPQIVPNPEAPGFDMAAQLPRLLAAIESFRPARSSAPPRAARTWRRCGG